MKNFVVKARLGAGALSVAIGASLALPAQAFYLYPPGSGCMVFNYVLPGNCTAYLPAQPRVLSAEDEGVPPPEAPPPPPGGEGSYPPPPEGQYQPPDGEYRPPEGQYPQPPQGDYHPPEGQYQPQGDGQPRDQQMQQEDQQRRLQGMKQGMKHLERSLKEFERMIASQERRGETVPAELKEKLAKAKAMVAAVQSASSPEELEQAGLADMEELMRSLEEARREYMEGAQRAAEIKRHLKSMEQGVKMFERQVARLQKAKIIIPTGITENLAKVKAIIAQIKEADTASELEAVSFDDLQESMQALDEQRPQLEMLARWPQVKKQLDRAITKLTSHLKKSKAAAARLAKKGIDVSELYTQFETAVNQLKAVRDDAAAKVAAGEAEAAMELLEGDFFEQMDDVMQHQRIIEVLSNFSRFGSRMKQELANAQRQIKALKKQKVNTAELESLLAQVKAEGEQVNALLKAKPLDADAAIAALDEFENTTQEFHSLLAELTGEDEDMPWEQGPSQFQRLEMPDSFESFMDKRSGAPEGASGDFGAPPGV